MTAEAYAGAAAHALPGDIVKLTYAVPDLANPTDATLSLEERRGLLALAFDLGIPLIKDAAYTARRYEGEAIPSVMALEVACVRHVDAARVIYCGTFSKTLNPGLRVSWICAARPASSRLILAKQASDLNSPLLNQTMMCQKNNG
jgi:DNA-binding transcriptional MocR family regulator